MTVDAVRWIDGRPVSPRSSDVPGHTLDLTPFYNQGLGVPELREDFRGRSVLLRPDGLHRLLGIDYDLRGAIALGWVSSPIASPPSVRIPLSGSRVAALNVLAAALTTRQDGKALAYLNAILHYEDGSRVQHPFAYVRDLTQFWQDDRDESGANGPPWTAWLNYPSHHFDYLAHPRTLTALRMDNPHPDRAVVAVEFAAEQVLWAAPWILAVTLEPPSDAAALALGDQEPPAAR